ncbi:antibiotic biosynthesis monooxygenase [Streptomyces sp. NEAU-S7GS2]|uniref:antibiotic biosynthesis monooxygenase n=1 Tax=Streptomyces sp. NEAU-S7GS2 TaxID=2202000 RepID=UPI000D6F6F3D|nr:antibiotic biosynthesis monooxygenase [Streptomyces sp. NEAU-S7GS2]AWN27953.1 antibiotic biosynthesis monooxygenase [Streptomyces sp. NEAU-S7GS2]
MTSSHDAQTRPGDAQTRPGTGPGTRAGFRTDVFPEIRRADAGAVLISEWDAGSPAGQRAVLDGVAHAWEETPLPAGFLSRVLFAGTDGRSVLNYAQWTSDAAHREFVRTENTGLSERIAAVLDGVGDVGNSGPGRFRLYRSMLPHGAPQEPGCVVRVAFRTTGHDAARGLVDGLLERVGERQRGDGGIASHFHISEDGDRVVNYSEWTDPESHEREVGRALQPQGQVLSYIDSLPGVEPLGFRRYVAPRGLVRG